jgi:hypothetical protein
MNKSGLFLPESKRDPTEYIRFGSGSMRYVFHPSMHKKCTEWPTSTDEYCLHCEEQFEGPPIPIPTSYDPITGKMETMPGIVCSGPCLKGYLVEHTQFYTPLRLAIACRMLVEVFGIDDWCGTAPPRTSLQRHGGPFTAAHFRGTPSKQVTIARNPPFQCLPIVYETTIPSAAPTTDSAQQAPALFEDVVDDEKEPVPEITVFPPPLPVSSLPTPATAASAEPLVVHPRPSSVSLPPITNAPPLPAALPPPPQPSPSSLPPLPPPRKRAPRKPKATPATATTTPTVRKLNPLEALFQKQ